VDVNAREESKVLKPSLLLISHVVIRRDRPTILERTCPLAIVIRWARWPSMVNNNNTHATARRMPYKAVAADEPGQARSMLLQVGGVLGHWQEGRCIQHVHTDSNKVESQKRGPYIPGSDSLR